MSTHTFHVLPANRADLEEMRQACTHVEQAYVKGVYGQQPCGGLVSVEGDNEAIMFKLRWSDAIEKAATEKARMEQHAADLRERIEALEAKLCAPVFDALITAFETPTFLDGCKPDAFQFSPATVRAARSLKAHPNTYGPATRKEWWNR